MLLSVYFGLLVIAGFFIWLGYRYGETAYSILGFVFIFILTSTVGGAVPGLENVYIISSNNETHTYTYTNTTLTSETVNTVENYTPVMDGGTAWFSRLLLILSGLGFALSVTEIRKLKGL